MSAEVALVGETSAASDTAPGTAPTRRRRTSSQARHGDKLNSILHVAAQLFAEHGYEATSLDTIADRLGMHKASLYHYVSGKEDILYRCLVASFGDLDDVLTRMQDHQVPVIDRLRLFFRRLAVAQNNDFGRCLVLVGAKPLGLNGGTEIGRFQRRLTDTVRDLINEGVANGSLKTAHPGLVVSMMFGALNWVPRWHRETGPLNVEDIAQAYCDMLLNGIAQQH